MRWEIGSYRLAVLALSAGALAGYARAEGTDAFATSGFSTDQLVVDAIPFPDGMMSATLYTEINPVDSTTIGAVTQTGGATWQTGGKYVVTLGEAPAIGSSTGPTTNGAPGIAPYGHSDVVTVKGNLTVETGFILDLWAAGTTPTFNPLPNQMYEWLITVTSGGTFVVNPAAIIINSNINNAPSYKFSVFTTTANGANNYIGVRYTYNAVPEATTLLLGLAGLTPVLLQRRGRRADRSA